MVEMGIGYSGLEKFSSIMGMPLMHQKSFVQHTRAIALASKAKAVEIMSSAASIVRKTYIEINNALENYGILNIGVSYDGTWMKRDHTSNYGVGICADLLTGLVLDFEVLSKYCQACSTMGEKLKQQDQTEYEKWYKRHDCEKNYNGTSGSMEVVAAEHTWNRSIQLHNLRYTTILSDGNCKSFNNLEQLNVYGDEFPIVKEECISHVSKWLGTALRNTRKEKKLGGKGHGRLTDLTIQKLTKYYERAIRSSVGNMDSIRCSVFASWTHCISSDEASHHTRCPSGEDSWCFYNWAIAKGEEPGPHKETLGTPLCPEEGEAVKPIYQCLADPSLLQRCLQGKTQNVNESLHSVIWKICPKTEFVSRRRVETAVASATSKFNSDAASIQSTLELMGILPGKITEAACECKNTERKKKSIQKARQATKQHRLQKKQDKLQKDRQQEHQEGTQYKAGSF